ncbi:MAG: dihydropteroate synthase [Cyclobacteriaceae bacterium]
MSPKHTIKIRGEIIDLSTPKVMGIINVTPDSFYPGSRAESVAELLGRTAKMLEEGADFLDVGGYSSRPGAEDISVGEEIDRVVSGISEIIQEFPNAVISADTFRSEVARAAVDAGASMVNDISAGHLDNKMLATVGELGVPYIAMHMRGTPQTMKALTEYENLITEIAFYFSETINRCRLFGINDLILDPGFGFAKTVEQNFQLLSHLDYFTQLGKPILAGLSRKSMIYRTLNLTADASLNGTTSLNTIALFKGAGILRVHDIREAVEVVKLVNQLS